VEGHVCYSGIGSETPQPIVLVVHQPATSKPVGDFFNYVGTTASAAGRVRLDAAARELNAVSGLLCVTHFRTTTMQGSKCFVKCRIQKEIPEDALVCKAC